jgi:hypothetical protein
MCMYIHTAYRERRVVVASRAEFNYFYNLWLWHVINSGKSFFSLSLALPLSELGKLAGGGGANQFPRTLGPPNPIRFSSLRRVIKLWRYLPPTPSFLRPANQELSLRWRLGHRTERSWHNLEIRSSPKARYQGQDWAAAGQGWPAFFSRTNHVMHFNGNDKSHVSSRPIHELVNSP